MLFKRLLVSASAFTALQLGFWALPAFAADPSRESVATTDNPNDNRGDYTDRFDNIGVGVMAGVAYAPNDFDENGSKSDGGVSEAWGLLVDIPVVPWFYLSPAATFYRVDLPGGTSTVTDLDMNFKFVMPVDAWRLGVGGLVGASNIEAMYRVNYGALIYAGYRIRPSLELFAMGRYKSIHRGNLEDVNNLHAFLGIMVRL